MYIDKLLLFTKRSKIYTGTEKRKFALFLATREYKLKSPQERFSIFSVIRMLL